MLIAGGSCISLCLLLYSTVVSTAVGLGGWKPVSVDDDRVKTVALSAVKQFEQMTNSLFTSHLIQIRRAETQIVAGVNYRLVLDIGYSNCKKNEVSQPSSCQTQQKQSCTFVVWDQPWLNKIQLTQTNCSSIEAVEVLTSDAEDAAMFAVSRLQNDANGMYLIHFKRILKTATENKDGIKYKLKIECLIDSCKSSELLSACKSGTRNESIICFVDVGDQQLKNPKYILESYRCMNLQSSGPKVKSYEVVKNLRAFEDFKTLYGKKYPNFGEEYIRFDVFVENLKAIKFLQDHELGTATYGVTQFADVKSEEFRNQYLTPYWDKKEDPRLVQAQIPSVNLPTDFDWRHFNVVTPVKNQGSCGSCWAFSVTGNIEGQWAIQRKNLISLSEQELVDCDKIDEGCNGGLPSSAYQEIQRLGGLESESDYPYKGRDDPCQLVKKDIHVYINGSLNISKNENDMAAWIYKNGPVSIGINAFAMQFYFGGISHPWKIFCSPDSLDHGVLIVGYGIKKGLFGDTPYWIVKNSWGSYWGEQGYYLVYRGDGTCGLNEMVSSAIVK